MSEIKMYSARTVFEGMKRKLHQYLEAQYHIWDESLIADRARLLEKEGGIFQEPRLEATPFYVPGKPYDKLRIPEAAKAVLNIACAHKSTGIPETPYQHQTDSLEAFLGENREIIVATGTGSGKTESFLMPIMGAMGVEAGSRPLSWIQPGCRALLLYPMNALVNDQVSRLRRILGQEDVAGLLQGGRDHRATFGMYTSRTPYPGEETAQKNKIRLGSFIEKAFINLPPDAEDRLKKEGKWPSKDLQQYLSSSFRTGPTDTEMLSRQEMWHRCPDILVTNYSMLEYMLLRPIEAPIFDQTAAWLAADIKNRFIVVLDEAHMYKGAGGAEVAYLLRRLHARLGIPRDRVKYILTSASLGSSLKAQSRMKSFAADLSGHEQSSKEFVLITGQQQLKAGERTATLSEAETLAGCDYSGLHEGESKLFEAANEFIRLSTALGYASSNELSDTSSFQNAVFGWLQSFGPAAFVANRITSQPHKLREIATLTFPNTDLGAKALECLLALMSFAKEKGTGKVFSPVRSHLFFRGLPGIYVCINPDCSARESHNRGILGKLYSTPRLMCDCGSRVYEVLTHRNCGAAFIRGYVCDAHGDFLWHQPSEGLWEAGGLVEAHFLVELNRRALDRAGRHEGSVNWLHKSTGRLSVRRPNQTSLDQYVEVLRPDGLVPVAGQSTLTFNNQCPVCTTNWRAGSTKIMDLATKGEAPFAQLVRTQVELQPQTIQQSDQSPNGGRKSLLFSDGRQKAARLARDIPREIENDVFRQLLLLGVKELLEIGEEPTLARTYASTLNALAGHSLLLFDGADRDYLRQDVQNFKTYYEGDLREALKDIPPQPPASFNSLLLRHLGSPFYSVSSLTLAHLAAAKRAYKQIRQELSDNLGEVDLRRILTVWIHLFSNKFAIDNTLAHGVRVNAAGHQLSGGLDVAAGLSCQTRAFLRDKIPNIDRVFTLFAKVLCQTSSSHTGFFIDPKKLVLVLTTEDLPWYQCSHCATVSPVEWWGHCPVCLANGVTAVNPGATDYLRARKGFFRDPVIDVLEGKARPFNLTVEEHTAQLSYRDVDEPSTTTEDFERRFRDILVTPTDTSIDVLSSTTTMEVGIDIGSLVAVGLRNIPPLRQNYQQRAGRTGRRGSAISMVVTYAQSSPHDNHYFENPELIIAGEPTLPGIDIDNQKIIERHIRAQLVQAYFHFENPIPGGSDIFSVLGKTLEFYGGTGIFSLYAFEEWIRSAESAKSSFSAIQKWLPISFTETPASVADAFLQKLKCVCPASADELEASELNLIEFLFSRGFFPSYAFPRDLCALQIEGPPERSNGFTKVSIIQRPQQGLNIALSEYAPGRFVVVDKKTYRVGTVAANGSSTVKNRAARLFSERRYYIYCSECKFTPGFRHNEPVGEGCPLCGAAALESRTVIVPQVVYPAGCREVDEHDDEQMFTNATSAQLSVPEDSSLNWKLFGVKGQIAFVRNQQLVMVNKGEEENGQHDGFRVCNQCGRAAVDDNDMAAHDRDYHISGRRPSTRCQGQYEQVYLGYSFNSDVLLLRIPIDDALRFDPVARTERAPLSDAIQSLAESIVLGIGRELDIDIREINTGFRFSPVGDDNFVDIFIYDTLSGGAGYATQAGEVMNNVMVRVESLLTNCDCSSSCDKCLRHYGNRFHHATLDRLLALDLLRFISNGALPAKLSVEEQQNMLRPLIGMLKLAGWQITYTNSAPITAKSSDGRMVDLYSYPSLVRPRYYGFVMASTKAAFSPYELSRDLPGAYGIIA